MKESSLTLNDFVLEDNSCLFPNSKNENYKYFPLSLLKDKTFQKSSYKSISTEKIQKYIEPHHHPDWNCIVFYNGFLLSELIPKDLKEFILIKENFDFSTLAYSSLLEEDYFKRLHMNYSPQTVEITLTKSLLVPFHIIYLTLEKDSISFPSIKLTLEENVKATLYTTYISGCQKPESQALSIPYIHTYLNKKSHLIFNHLTHNKPLVYNLSFLDIFLKEASQFDSIQVNTCGGLSLRNMHAFLLEEKAKCNINGAYYTKEHQHIEWICKVTHLVGKTFSNQLFKGIAAHKSSFSFNGDITVDEAAKGVEGHQLSKNIMLNPHAKIYTRPSLHIKHNDLICSHGATIGSLNPDQLFYLKTRGIPTEEAKKLILVSFMDEVFDFIQDPLWKENVKIHLQDMMD